MQQEKQKMCWNCDGTIHIDASFCPYCGSGLQEEKNPSGMEPTVSSDADALEKEENLASLYKPPYSPSNQGISNSYAVEEESPLYEKSYYQDAQEVIYSQEDREELTEPKSLDMGIWPLLFLSGGMNLLTIGLLLFFLSDHGKVVLEWNSHYWFVYCLIATPLLIFGWKLLQASSEKEESP